MKVTQGKEGWLFLDNDTNNVISQLTGELTFSTEELDQWKLLLETRSIWMKQRNISYFYTVIPNKGCVYPEYLPDSVHLSVDRCINQLIRYLEDYSFFRLIYPLTELLQAKQEMLAYRLTDTHWTFFGAYIGYVSLMSEIAKLYPVSIVPRSAVIFEAYDQPICDLGSKLGIPGGIDIAARLVDRKAECVFNNQIVGNGRVQIYENSNKNLPKAVLFRDSFSDFMLDFLAESFSRLVVAFQPHVDYAVIEAELPDVVINQQVERFLVRIPDDLKGGVSHEIAQVNLNPVDG